jgi:hypothetical protein
MPLVQPTNRSPTRFGIDCLISFLNHGNQTWGVSWIPEYVVTEMCGLRFPECEVVSWVRLILGRPNFLKP